MPAYARGSKAWGLCQRCGLRFLYRDLRADGYFPNIRVCDGCYDAEQPQERLAIVSDAVALYRPAPDTYAVYAPFLVVQVVNGAVLLNWSSIGVDARNGANVLYDSAGNALMDPAGGLLIDSSGNPFWKSGRRLPVLSAAYEVWRSSDGVNFSMLVRLTNQADEFGALSQEQLSYTDNSPPATAWYYVRGYDVLENATFGGALNGVLTDSTNDPLDDSGGGQLIDSGGVIP